MTETQVRLQKKFDEIMDRLSLAGGVSYEDAMTSIRPYIRDKNPLLVALLSGAVQDMSPASESGSFSPEYFNENAEKIDTREKMYSLFASLPDEAAQEFEQFLNNVLKKILPSQRLKLQQLAAHLPADPGGAPSKMPNKSDCRKICDYISKLHKERVLLGDAQRQAAKKWGLKLRMIQRIWAKRGKIDTPELIK
jgi:hypothetical protein